MSGFLTVELEVRGLSLVLSSICRKWRFLSVELNGELLTPYQNHGLNPAPQSVGLSSHFHHQTQKNLLLSAWFCSFLPVFPFRSLLCLLTWNYWVFSAQVFSNDAVLGAMEIKLNCPWLFFNQRTPSVLFGCWNTSGPGLIKAPHTQDLRSILITEATGLSGRHSCTQAPLSVAAQQGSLQASSHHTAPSLCKRADISEMLGLLPLFMSPWDIIFFSSS